MTELVLLVRERLHDDVEVGQDPVQLLLAALSNPRQRPEVGDGAVQGRQRGADIGLPAIEGHAELTKRFGHRLARRGVHGVEDVVDLDRLAGLRFRNRRATLEVGLAAALGPNQLHEFLSK